MLAFEARIEAMAHEDANATDKLEPRSIRAALDQHVAEEYLSSQPLDAVPSAEQVEKLIEDLRAAFSLRVGGL